MTPERIDAALAAHRLRTLGIVGADLPAGARALALVGPGPGFWDHFTTSPEYGDGAPDPLDRWSARILTGVARDLGAEPLFPFGGPPYHPFYSWALASGRAFASPVALLVHAELGLFVSYRGALALDLPLALPPAPRPCDACAKPCETACPVKALTPAGYDVAACKSFLDTASGADCRANGCRVRRACPVGQSERIPAQSAFHMEAFHPA